LQDYVVALPQEYYEAYQLQEKVTKPCQVNGANSLCNQFSYLSTKKPGMFTTELETGYIIQRPNGRSDTQLFKNESVQEQLDLGAMALLDNNQVRNTVTYSLTSHPGDLTSPPHLPPRGSDLLPHLPPRGSDLLPHLPPRGSDLLPHLPPRGSDLTPSPPTQGI